MPWALYHETLSTFEQTERTLFDSKKQCEDSNIKVILSDETYHNSIVPLMKAIMKRIHQMNREGPNQVIEMGISTICNRVREYAAYKDEFDEQTGQKHRNVPWAFEVILEIEMAKSDSNIVELYDRAYKRLEAENPITIGNTAEEVRQRLALEDQAYREIHDDILDHVVSKEWNKAVVDILRNYFHFILSEGDTILSGARNTDRIQALRNWVS